MVRRRRAWLSAEQKAEVWRRWRQGESLQTIGQALGWATKCMHYVVARTGGRPPAPRRRSRLALAARQREEISRGLASGDSLRAVGRRLGRAPSTVSREVRRHGGRRAYRAAAADGRAWERSRRPKPCRLATRPALRDAVASKLTLEWSPQQIAGWLRHVYSDNPEMHVSHETLYLSLFVQSRGVLKKALMATCASAGRIGARRTPHLTREAGSSTRSRFGNAPPRSRTARSPGIGKATCSWAGPIPRSRRWGSGPRATSC